MRFGRITFFGFIFFLAGMALFSFLLPLKIRTKSTTTPVKGEGTKAIEIQSILLTQFNLNELDWNVAFTKLQEGSFPTEIRRLVEKKEILLTQDLYIQGVKEQNKWFIEDIGKQKQYLLQREHNGLSFYYLPISAVMKEPIGTVFCAIDVQLEHKSGTFEGALNLESQWYPYHYRQPFYLQDESKKKQTFLIERAKNEYYYGGNSDLELNLLLEYEGRYAPLSYKRQFSSQIRSGHAEKVLVISKDPISFGGGNPFYQVHPKELESTLVRLLELDLIVLYDRTLPYLNTSQLELLSDYVRLGGKLFFCEEKVNQIPVLSDALSGRTWSTATIEDVSYQYLYYYQGVVAKITHPEIYEMDFRMKFKETYGRHDVPDYRLFKEILFFPTLPPILGPFTFATRSIFDKYFASSWIGLIFFLLLFLCCGPGFLLIFRKARGFKLLYIQFGLLIGFSVLSLFFTHLLMSQTGFIDTFSFYYMNEKKEGYVLNYHMLGGAQNRETSLTVTSEDPFYLLSPLGENFPDPSSYSGASVVNQYVYSKKWENPHFSQKLWKPFPLNTTQIIQKEGFVLEGSFLNNKTPFPFEEIFVFEVENTHSVPYSNKSRQDYRHASAGSSFTVKEVEIARRNYYYNREEDAERTVQRRFDLRGLTLTHSNMDGGIFRRLRNSYNDLVDWYPKFGNNNTLFVGLPNGLYVLAYGGFDQTSLLENQEVQIVSPMLKQSSRTVVWLQRLGDKLP